MGVRAGRPDRATARRWRCASTPARRFGALLLLLLVTLTVAGLAVGFLAAVQPAGRARPARAPAASLVGALAVVPAVAILMLANAPGGIDGQVSKAWKQATDPAVSRPGNTPERLTATSSGRARYWREALKVHAPGAVARHRRRRLRHAAPALPRRRAHGPPRARLRRADALRPRLGRARRSRCSRRARGWPRRSRTVGLRRRDRGLPWDAERVGARHARRRRDRLRRALGDRLDLVRPRQRRPGAALRGLGRVARDAARARAAGLESRAAAASPRRCASALPRSSSLIAPDRRRGARCSPSAPSTRRTPRSTALDKGELAAAASIAEIAHDRNPLVGRSAVRPRRRSSRPPAATPQARARARAGGRPRARQPGDVAPARAAAARRAQRPQGRAERLPGRVLPRSALAAEHDSDVVVAVARASGGARAAG